MSTWPTLVTITYESILSVAVNSLNWTVSQTCNLNVSFFAQFAKIGASVSTISSGTNLELDETTVLPFKFLIADSAHLTWDIFILAQSEVYEEYVFCPGIYLKVIIIELSLSLSSFVCVHFNPTANSGATIVSTFALNSWFL